jgi:hypothetical protein
MHDSDSIYHRLFADPRMVAGLVHEFVPPEVAASFDCSGLQRVNAKFYPGRRSARRREGDVIWRLPTREDRRRYLYLMIEFQSESDEWMAVRTQVYQGLLWQQVIDEQPFQTGARLPPLLLLVLYRGNRRWKAVTETRGLMDLSPDSCLWPWQPQARYRLLDMGSFSNDELARRSNPVAFLFRLEQPQTPETFEALVHDVRDWFRQHTGYERLRALFTELIREARVKCGIGSAEFDHVLEEKTVLVDTFESWKTQWFAEGEAKGKAEALITLLAGRFGVLEPSWRERIHGADLATLEHWFERAIAAPDLPSVFSS